MYVCIYYMSQARAAILGAGAGAAASLLLLRLWSTSADESWDDVSVDSDGESEDEADASQHPPAVVRDDYSSTDAPYKMLLIFNMELYKLSSKTGEMKTVKMSPGKAAAQSGHLPLPVSPLPPPPPPSTHFLPRLGTPPSARTGARCGSAPTRCATGCGSVQITAPRVAAQRQSPTGLAGAVGQMKITVKCPTVAELLELERRCIAAGLNCCLIRDAGRSAL